MPSHGSSTAEETVLQSLEMEKEKVLEKESEAKLENLQYEKTVTITWACRCGSKFQESVIEFAPGAAQKLVQAVIDLDIESMAGLSSALSSSSSLSSSSTEYVKTPVPVKLSRRSQNKSTNAANESESTGAKTHEKPIEAQYILLCKSRGNEIVLKHADISKTLCDQSSYQVLHRKHYGRLSGIFRWATLKQIESVEFVRFHLYWKKNVSIDTNDIGALPPSDSEEYCFSADTNPPVLKSALRHFIEHPSHAPKHPYHRPRIPKKLRVRLDVNKELITHEGYGIFVKENICWTKVFVIEVVFATCCLIFAVVWCRRNERGIQDGFAIAGTGLSYLTIMLGGLQAVFQ
ncbi:hypothetical protein BGZ60DRAFT_424740 [Tricladium varicosporioides]|nr:hypothetical protein BGZ60DRAFT_424740 [Hymenoscyphus varicosporioides]